MVLGVTGASGHLGGVIVNMLPEAEPIGREIPDRRYEAIIHAAAPNFRADEEVERFARFNRALAAHIERHPPEQLIVTGSWWQYAEGSCRGLSYTRLKDHQRELFPRAVHLIPYSIYGDEARPGRGFVPHLINAIKGAVSLSGLSDQERDFIHVTDVALAHIRALDTGPGTYEVATETLITPRDLAGIFGVFGGPLEEFPGAEPRYLAERLPGWEPTVDVLEHITGAL